MRQPKHSVKKKLEERYDAIILAKAGVERMGWTKKIGEILTGKQCRHAIGQGAKSTFVAMTSK